MNENHTNILENPQNTGFCTLDVLLLPEKQPAEKAIKKKTREQRQAESADSYRNPFETTLLDSTGT